MKKILRIILAIIILILLVFIFIVGSLVFLFDPNKIKPIIISEINRKTGYQINIEGRLNWTFYPALGIKAKRITLASPGSAPFVDLRNVTFVTDTKQLLHGYKKLQGDVRIDDVYFVNLHATNAHVGMHSNKTLLTFDPITASLYSGDLEGNARAENLMITPHWTWNVLIKQVQLKPLLIDVLGADSKIKIAGTGNLNVIGESEGINKNQILNSLSGSGNLNIVNGVVEGFDINYLVQVANDLINGKSISLPTNSIGQTNFESLSSSFRITNGVITTSDLLLDSSAFITKGYGRIDLINQLQSWQLQVVPVQPGEVKWMVPILIEGNLTQPSVRLDMQMINAIITKEQIERVKLRVKEQIKELPAKANKFLQKLMTQ